MQAQIREIICEAATPPITMIDVIRGLPLSGSRTEHVFPTLTPAQIRRIAAHGHKRATQAGDVLVERGDVAVPFFVVVSGELEVLRPEGATDTLVAVHSPGQFTGVVSTLSGRRALFRLRAANVSEVIELDRRRMLALVQADAQRDFDAGPSFSAGLS